MPDFSKRAPTVEELYEKYMDIGEEDPVSFAEDVYQMFGGERTEMGFGEWEKKYGMYIPSYDPTQTYLAGRERDLDYQRAADILDLTSQATDRVYTTELDTLSSQLGAEMAKGRTAAGKLGLRSGQLESAIQDTVAKSANKAENLGDRLQLSEIESRDKYNAAMVDAAIDFEKTSFEEKEQFYDRTLATVMKLVDKEAFAVSDVCACMDACVLHGGEEAACQERCSRLHGSHDIRYGVCGEHGD